DNHDQLRIALADSITGNRIGQNSSINLRVATADGKPVFSSLSAAVIDDHIVPDDNAADCDNILSYLLLSSNLKGQIEKPGYYFAADNEERHNALDLLMLTQGYRRFEWKTILSDEAANPVYMPASGIMLSGKVTTASGKPVPRAKITMYSKVSNLFLDTLANNNGEFTFGPMALQDSLKVILTALKPDGGTDVVISLQQTPASTAYVTGAIHAISQKDTSQLPAAFKQNALEQYKQAGKDETMMLKEVKVNALKNANKASEYSANLNGPGNADQVIKFDDVALLGPDIPTILIGRIPGVRLVKGALVSSRAGSFRLGTAMGVVYDGVFYDGSLTLIDPLTIETIEVLKSAAYTGIYGSRGANGVLIITSKHGTQTNMEKSRNVVTATLHGFYKAREYYIPKYGAKNKNEPTDLRSTIFWKPDILTDKDGKASFNFLNGVNKSTYRVVIEGIDSDGRLGYQVLKYHVE
ncbi:MAG: TonB-dependent receptor plug domain-containing protein, partial [Mucilaginibacter sp.]